MSILEKKSDEELDGLSLELQEEKRDKLNFVDNSDDHQKSYISQFEKFSNQAVEKRMLSKIVFWQNANNPNESNLQTLIFHTMSHTLLISRKTTKQEIELCTNNF